MMFKEFLNASTYNEERTKSRIRKARIEGEIVGYYTEMFLRKDDQRLARRLTPRRMELKDFASVWQDERLISWEKQFFTK